jgi:uncharacterized protein (TIGR02266 family)
MHASIGPWKHVDTRDGSRVNVYVGVDVFSDHNIFTALTMNVSEGGMFVATRTVMPVGSYVVVHMRLPLDDDPITALAEVRWVRAEPLGEHVPAGMGLRFGTIDERDRDRVRFFVEGFPEATHFDC